MPESLNPFDLFVIVVLVASTFWGGMRGIVSQLASLLSWLASWYVASHYYGFAAQFISEDHPWRIPAATAITFVVSALAIRVATNFIKKIISFAGLKEFDRQMGALLGLAKGLLLCLLATFFMVILSEKARSILDEARTGPFFVKTVAMIQARVPQSELTKKFQTLAGVITENAEADESEEQIDAQVNYLVKSLLSNGLSASAAKGLETELKDEKNGTSGSSDGSTGGQVSILETAKAFGNAVFARTTSAVEQLEGKANNAIGNLSTNLRNAANQATTAAAQSVNSYAEVASQSVNSAVNSATTAATNAVSDAANTAQSAWSGYSNASQYSQGAATAPAAESGTNYSYGYGSYGSGGNSTENYYSPAASSNYASGSYSTQQNNGGSGYYQGSYGSRSSGTGTTYPSYGSGGRYGY